MVYFNNEKLFFTHEKIVTIINENKQLLFGINILKSNNSQEKVLRLLARLQKNLFILAHISNQPKAPRHLMANELLRPALSCEYSSENKISTTQYTNTNRTPNLTVNSPAISTNISQQAAYFENCNTEFRPSDSKQPDKPNLQTCENPNINISNSHFSKVCFDQVLPISTEYEVQNNIGMSIINSSSSSNFIQNQNNEHFICRYCQRKCRNQSGLTQHTMKVHPDAPEVQHLLKQAQSRSNPNPLSIINVNSSNY
ncbi:C2H2 finger domain containing protein [Cryptosporidium felis]|nr:C2H2 finger domain containing protein [Cryptosporidium felis]